MRELDYLAHVGGTVAGVCAEIAEIPVDEQNPVLNAAVLACAAIVDDPENFAAAPGAFARMTALLDELHAGDDDE